MRCTVSWTALLHPRLGAAGSHSQAATLPASRWTEREQVRAHSPIPTAVASMMCLGTSSIRRPLRPIRLMTMKMIASMKMAARASSYVTCRQTHPPTHTHRHGYAHNTWYGGPAMSQTFGCDRHTGYAQCCRWLWDALAQHRAHNGECGKMQVNAEKVGHTCKHVTPGRLPAAVPSQSLHSPCRCHGSRPPGTCKQQAVGQPWGHETGVFDVNVAAASGCCSCPHASHIMLPRPVVLQRTYNAS